jgi:tripartite ATP-independent transporter DctM subunit
MIVLGMFVGLSVGKLFIGGIIPGLILSFLFMAYIGIRSMLQPQMGPAVPPEERPTWMERFISLRAIILPILLVIVVMGVIFVGAATPTEASAIGAFGSILSAAVYRRLTWGNFKEACFSTLRISCMVIWIMFAASCFTSLYIVAQAPQLVGNLLTALPGGRWVVIIVIQAIFFVMGCFLDPTGILMISIPVFFPVIKSLGFDPLWFGVLFVINMEMALITPPFGYNLFYMKAIAPKGINMEDIYRSVLPFVILQIVGLAIIMIFPQTILWLPNLMIR